MGQLPDDYRTVRHLIDFDKAPDKAPDKARDKVYSTPGGALISKGNAALPMVIGRSIC